MQPELDKYGVSIFALSKDSVADAARHIKRDQLNLTVLSDPKLDVIKQYGVEHHKAVEFSTIRFTLFTIPLALGPSFKTMAIPTTLIIDETGIIQWIDQADDYRLRSDNDRVIQAVKSVFG